MIKSTLSAIILRWLEMGPSPLPLFSKVQVRLVRHHHQYHEHRHDLHDHHQQHHKGWVCFPTIQHQAMTPPQNDHNNEFVFRWSSMSFSVLAMELWIVNVDVVKGHPSKVNTRSKSSTGIINFNVAKGMIFYHSNILRISMASFFQISQHHPLPSPSPGSGYELVWYYYLNFEQCSIIE